jgi:phosphoglycolate phosphatase
MEHAAPDSANLDQNETDTTVEASIGAPSGADALETPADIGSPADGIAKPEEAKKIRYRAKPKYAFPIPVKAVLLDLDGTLLDTAGDIVIAANRMRQAFGFAPLDAAVIRNFIGKGISNLVGKVLKDAVGEVGPSAIKVAVANFEKHYAECFAETSKPFPGVIEGLDALRAKGFRLGCVTNKARQFTEPLLEKTGLTPYFEIAVSGDTLAEKKPHPLPLTHAAEFFACMPQEMLMIGDSVNDAEAARAAGCPVFIVPYGYNEGQELRGLDCDAFIDDLPSALKYVKMPI